MKVSWVEVSSSIIIIIVPAAFVMQTLHFFLYTDDYIRLVEGYSDETFTDKTLFLCMFELFLFELSDRVKQSSRRLPGLT